MTYPIHEMFNTFQGEGVHVGKAAFFVRTYGCPVHCPWCDAAGTWHPKYVPKEIQKLTAEDIVNEALADEANIVVITGGEPTVYDLNPLVAALHLANLQVHLETSGGFPITGLMDWITLSPKRWKPPKVDSVMLADEFKIIVEHPDDIHYYHGLLLETGLPTIAKNPIWLHPEWSHRDDPKVLEAIVRAVKAGPTFRAGWQLHKLYKVDQQDKRSQVQVPLGGDLAKGL